MTTDIQKLGVECKRELSRLTVTKLKFSGISLGSMTGGNKLDILLTTEPLYCINKYERQKLKLPAKAGHWASCESNYPEVIEGDGSLLHGEYANNYLVLQSEIGSISATSGNHLEEKASTLEDAGFQNATRVIEYEAKVAKVAALLTAIFYNWDFQATRGSWLAQMRWESTGQRHFESSHCGEMMVVIGQTIASEGYHNETDQNWMQHWQEIILYYASLEDDVFLGHQTWSYINSCGNAEWILPARYDVRYLVNRFRFDHRLELEIEDAEKELVAGSNDLLALIQDMSRKGQYHTKNCKEAISALQTITDYHMDVVFRNQLRQDKLFRVFTSKDLKAIEEFEQEQLQCVSHPQAVYILYNWFKKFHGILHWNKICVGYAWCKIEFSTSMTLDKFIICYSPNTREPLWMNEKVKFGITGFLAQVASFSMKQQAVAKKKKPKGGKKHRGARKHVEETGAQNQLGVKPVGPGNYEGEGSIILDSASSKSESDEVSAVNLSESTSRVKQSEESSSHNVPHVGNRLDVNQKDVVKKSSTRTKRPQSRKESRKSKRLQASNSSHAPRPLQDLPVYQEPCCRETMTGTDIRENGKDSRATGRSLLQYGADETGHLQRSELRLSKNPFAVLDADLLMGTASQISIEDRSRAYGKAEDTIQPDNKKQQKHRKSVKREMDQSAANNSTEGRSADWEARETTKEYRKLAGSTEEPKAKEPMSRPQHLGREVGECQEHLRRKSSLQKPQFYGQEGAHETPIGNAGERGPENKKFESAWPTILESTVRNIGPMKANEKGSRPEQRKSAQKTNFPLNSREKVSLQPQEYIGVSRKVATEIGPLKQRVVTEKLSPSISLGLRQDTSNISAERDSILRESERVPDPTSKKLEEEYPMIKDSKISERQALAGNKIIAVERHTDSEVGVSENPNLDAAAKFGADEIEDHRSEA